MRSYQKPISDVTFRNSLEKTAAAAVHGYRLQPGLDTGRRDRDVPHSFGERHHQLPAAGPQISFEDQKTGREQVVKHQEKVRRWSGRVEDHHVRCCEEAL